MPLIYFSSLHQTDRKGYIAKGERELENSQELSGQLLVNTGDIEEKTRRLDKLKADFKNANYDGKLSQNTEKKTVAESKRERLNQEFILLNREAESRANLNLKRKDINAKNIEIESKFVFLYPQYFQYLIDPSSVDSANTKLVKLIGKTASIESIESVIEKIAK